MLPDVHLEQLKPLGKAGSQFLWNFIANVGLQYGTPFNEPFFSVVDKARIDHGNEKVIKKWRYHRGLPFDKEVYLSWQPGEAMIVPWKILIKYFDCFYYSSSDDLTVIDESL